MKAVDFYKLPRAIQDRFVGSVVSGFPPAPILASKVGTPTKLIWLGISGASFLLLVIVARVGYGSLDSGLSLHSAKALVLYLGLLFGMGFGLAQAFAQVVREKALPYAAGVYLFPACVIDARSDQFRIFDTQDLQSADAQGAGVRLAFTGGVQFVLPVGPGQSAASLVTEVNAARDRAMRAKATEDEGELVAVDPLHNPRFSSPVGPRDAYGLKLPPWGKLGWAVALGVAVVFGPLIWLLRNSGSDNTMYARATQANDSASYRQYLEHGERHKDEVAGILLPRTELADAQKQGTVEALLDYKAKHPDSKIAGEVALAIRAAMLGELEKAKAKGTLAALTEFEKRYPEHGIAPELAAAKHAVYTRELDAYKKRTPNKDKAVLPLVERLFAFAEKSGPRIEIRFRHRKKSESMGRADQSVGKSPAFMGEISYPSHYFDEKHSQKREEALGKTLATELDHLSPELFDIHVTAPVPVEADALPDVTVPTLFVTYSADWSGHQYVAPRPRGAYVGISFPFEALFVVPGDPKPWKYRMDIVKQPNIGKLRTEEPMPQPGDAEEGVYAAMGDDAFEQAGHKLLSLFFKADKQDK
jgi:hypothetical protein